MQDREPTLGDGRYMIRRELGRGTMGVVYEAYDTLLARTVAVKTIDLTLAASAGASRDFEQRFFTEARVAARLAHPGIVVCHDFDKDASSGKLFIVFEYLQGRTLAERAAEGAMAWREALAVVVQVARAIHHAHVHGVVHRDLKPANIMLLAPALGEAAAARGDVAVKIMDFGVARLESPAPRLTRPGQAFGTPLYMSPEQALGEPTSAPSDIFSLGSVLCTLLLGRPWFDAPSLPGIVDRVVHSDPPRLSSLRPGLPAALDAVVATALAKREEDRYASASDMADDLEDVLADKEPEHAPALAARAPGRASADDALLAGLAVPAGGRRGLPAQDPLALLLDEAPPVSQPTEGRTATIATPGSRRRRRVPAGAILGAAVLGAALVAWRLASSHAPAPPPSLAVAADQPTPVAAGEPVLEAPTAPATTAPTPATAPPAPATPAPTAPFEGPAASPTVPAVRPTQAAPRAEAAAESPPAKGPDAARPLGGAAGSRIRLSVEHPFESGRLIVWIDGVLVHETKLQASGSKRIVGFKVREGRAETLLDVVPGPHEVRVEVTWDQGRSASTKVVDVAQRSTGLLEVRVGRMSKEVNLTWSRLAKE